MNDDRVSHQKMGDSTNDQLNDPSETISLLQPLRRNVRSVGISPTMNDSERPPSKRLSQVEISIPLLKGTTIDISTEHLIWFFMFLANIMSWYFTNGMNGISMQSFAASLHTSHSDGKLTYDDLSLTSVVTFLQLLAGAALGIGLLFVLSLFQQHPNKPQKHFLSKTFSYTTSDLLLSSLHGIGSLATNLGFVYGSASLVQILKLIEPFETLLLTKLCSAEESKLLSISIISSMTTVTMAAIALVQQRNTKPHPAAIFFALCSGLALSSRNVFQRRWYSKQPTKPASTSVDSNPSNDMESGKGTAVATTETISKPSGEPSVPSSSDQINRLLQSLTSFTQLSLQSGVMLAVMTLIQLLLSGNIIRVLSGFTIVPSTLSLATSVHYISWKVFLWHPLYNVFSMVTLGFCSALTHSLLNAGKRVVAIIMAIVWFHEPFSLRTVTTLAVIAVGGSWYVMAMSNKGGAKFPVAGNPISTACLLQHKLVQPMLCLILLSIVYYEPLVNALLYG